MVLEPVSNQVSTHAARRAEVTRRADKARRRGEEGEHPVREGDTFLAALDAANATDPTRRLADVDQEEAREDRQAAHTGSTDQHPTPGGSLDLSA